MKQSMRLMGKPAVQVGHGKVEMIAVKVAAPSVHSASG